MIYEFDGANRVCILQPGTYTLDIRDLYSRWKEWVAQDDNSKYLPCFDVVGGDPILGNTAIASYFFVINGWKIRPCEENHTLTVTGILNTDDGSDPFTNTLGQWRVRIVQIVPLQAETITVDGSGSGSGATADQIANSVWSHPFVKKLLTIPVWLSLRSIRKSN